jgi:hypothetical protein
MCRQHTQLYMCRQHTYMCRGWWQVPLRMCVCSSICVVSIRQHTSAYVTAPLAAGTTTYVALCVSSAYVSIRQHTSRLLKPAHIELRGRYHYVYVSSYYHVCILRLLCVLTPLYIPSTYYMCPLILRYMCPHATIYMSFTAPQ